MITLALIVIIGGAIIIFCTWRSEVIRNQEHEAWMRKEWPWLGGDDE